MLFIFPFIGKGQTDSASFLMAPTDFAEFIDTSKTALLIDVRLKKDYKKNRIPNAINAETKKVLTQKTKTLDLKTPLLLYCYESTRSTAAAKFLKQKGFVHVFVLQGGIEEWEELGFPLDD